MTDNENLITDRRNEIKVPNIQWPGVGIMNKREQIAAMCLQGLLASQRYYNGGWQIEDYVEYALQCTDELLAALAKSQDGTSND